MRGASLEMCGKGAGTLREREAALNAIGRHLFDRNEGEQSAVVGLAHHALLVCIDEPRATHRLA
jgi:hypothetical protein